MIKKNRELFNATLYILFGTMGGLFIGMARNGQYTFDIFSPMAQYYFLSIAFATLIALYIHTGFRGSIIYTLPLALLSAVPGQRLYFTNIINITLFLIIGITAFHFIWHRFGHNIIIGKFLILGIVMVIFETVRVPLLSMMYGTGDFMQPLQMSMIVSSTIAGGVGLGIETAELLSTKMFRKQYTSIVS